MQRAARGWGCFGTVSVESGLPEASDPRTVTTPFLLLLNGEQFSGLERLVDHLVRAAPAQGFHPVLVLLKPGQMLARMSSPGAEVHEVPMRSRFDLSVARKVALIAAVRGCRLVHSHTVRSALVARRVQRLSRLPWVHHVHSPALYESRDRFRNLVNYVVEAQLLRHADSLLAVSRSLCGYVSRRYGVDPARVTVVPNGVPFRQSPLRARTSEACTTILTVGLFRPRKGLEHLVDAAALLRDAGHDFRLRLAGEFAETTYEAAIRQRVDRLRLGARVEFLGFVADVEGALGDCDIFVLPSLHGEGMPMAVLEAMSMSRPVVASDIDGIRELLESGAGLLVPPASVQPLADALGRLIAAPLLRTDLARAGLARQRRCYTIQMAQQRVFDAYRELLHRKLLNRELLNRESLNPELLRDPALRKIP